MKQRACAVLFSTAGSLKEAQKIADSLVRDGLVACVNVVPSIVSIYRWKGKIHHDPEALMIMKTERKLVPEVKKAIRSQHSYETPELIALAIQAGLPKYLKWITDSVSHRKRK